MPPLLRRSPWDARLDVLQSASGLFLALVLTVHLLLVASILIGEPTFFRVVKSLELNFDGVHGYPWVVSLIGLGIGGLIALHALIALRKFPQNWRQWQRLGVQLNTQVHRDTRLWVWQVLTGFAIFFFVPLHLWTMVLQPEAIDPWQSGARVRDFGMIWVYLPLLLMADLHAMIGVYRLAIKWGGISPARRQSLQRLKTGLSVLFISLGLLSLLALWRVAPPDSPEARQQHANIVTEMQR